MTSFATFICVAVLPSIAYPSHPSAYPYAPFFPFPVPEFLLSAALWSLAYLLRDALYNFIAALTSYLPFIPPAVSILISTGLHTLLSLLLQQSALPLLLVPQYAFSNHPTASNPAFKRVWWIALGWAAAEAVTAVKNGYEAIALYRGVLVTAHRNDFEAGAGASPVKPDTRFSESLPGSTHTLGMARYSGAPSSDELLPDERRPLLSDAQHSHMNGNGCEVDVALKMQVDQNIDELIALRNREELEEMYGIPVIVRFLFFFFFFFPDACLTPVCLSPANSRFHILPAAHQLHLDVARRLSFAVSCIHVFHCRHFFQPFISSVPGRDEHATPHYTPDGRPCAVWTCGSAYASRPSCSRCADGSICMLFGFSWFLLCRFGGLGGSCVAEALMSCRPTRKKNGVQYGVCIYVQKIYRCLDAVGCTIKRLCQLLGSMRSMKTRKRTGIGKVQLLDAFQQTPQPISTLYTGRLWCRQECSSCPPIEKFHREEMRQRKAKFEDTHIICKE